MVFFFTPRGCEPAAAGEPQHEDYMIYMGLDKHENEDLIKWGLPQDVWFHVDALSSAHVYLRLPRGAAWDDIPAETLEDCVTLVKANSIEGSKLARCDVVYTPWSNLRKTASMAVGQHWKAFQTNTSADPPLLRVAAVSASRARWMQVGFRDQKAVKKVVALKTNEIVNRLNRTKREESPDLAARREAYDAEVRRERRVEVQEQKRKDKAAREESQKQKEARSYSTLMQANSMTSSAQMAKKYSSAQEYEDDFM